MKTSTLPLLSSMIRSSFFVAVDVAGCQRLRLACCRRRDIAGNRRRCIESSIAVALKFGKDDAGLAKRVADDEILFAVAVEIAGDDRAGAADTNIAGGRGESA